MIDSLSDAIASIEAKRKTIEVYSASPDEAAQLTDQFSTKNVAVDHSPLPDEADEGFVIIRGPDGAFQGSIALSTFATILAPEIHPPWTLVERDTAYDQIFDFLDNTLFSSFNRRQMLATAREIEERAWRYGAGRLNSGFQTAKAYQAQESVYERLTRHEHLSVQLYVHTSWENEISDLLPVQSVSADEIGEFWFIFYDGGGSELAKCARFTTRCVSLSQEAVGSPSNPPVKRGDGGFADWVIVGLHCLREYLDPALFSLGVERLVDLKNEWGLGSFFRLNSNVEATA